MSTSKHLGLRVAIAGLLTAGPALAGGYVFQNRDYTLPTGRDAQVHVNLEKSDPIDIHLGLDAPRDWESTVAIVVLARRSGSVEAADAADAIWTDAYARLAADQTLGGQVWDMLPGEMDTEPDEADTSITRLTWRLTLRHRTTNQTIS